MKHNHILVCLSSAPSNARIVREAGRMAEAYQADFTALFVETSDYAGWSGDNKARLKENTELAKSLGARIETVSGEDVALQISEYAKLAGITTIVMGRSAAVRRTFLPVQPMTDRLLSLLPDLDIHIIPDLSVASAYVRDRYSADREAREKVAAFSLHDLLISFGILVLATASGFGLSVMKLPESNLITIYILGVLMIAVLTEYRIYSLASSVISVLLFNFFFTEPRYTLFVHEQNYAVTFLVMFLVAFMTGSLASRLKFQAKLSAEAAYRTQILLDTNQLLQQVTGQDALLETMEEQLRKLLRREIRILPGDESRAAASEEENRAEDAHVRTENGWEYHLLKSANEMYGEVGIRMGGRPLSVFETSIVQSILGECVLALENERNRLEKEKATILAQKEQFRANLLRSISHDLRTPLTSISGNAANLVTDGELFEEAVRRRIYEDIRDDADWLIELVENLLSISRLEGGQIQIHTNAELVEEVTEEALRHIDRHASEHVIAAEHEDEFLMAEMDARLIVQVIINLVNNAVKYTQKGSRICVHSRRCGAFAEISVEDDGPGIPEDQKDKVFEMFYSYGTAAADSRRSLGLGLALCRSIVTAHGGTITAENRSPKGSAFRFTLPIREVKLDE